MDLSIIIRSDKRHNTEQSGNQVEALVSVLQMEIESIRHQAAVEVIVVDSASAEGDLRSVIQQFPSVRLVPSALELNPPQSYNLGANLARSRSLLFLSADTLLAHGSLLKCLDMVVQYPRCSLFYGRLFEHHVNSVGSNSPTGHSGGALAFENGVGHGVPLLVSKGVLLEIGGFDEHLEELQSQRDLCQRIKAFGREVMAWDEFRTVDLSRKPA